LGQKVHPTGLRLGIVKTWDSKWYAKKNYGKLLHEDLVIKRYLKQQLANAGVAKIEVERAANKTAVNIYAAKPGIIIGKKGQDVERTRKELLDKIGRDITINIREVRNAETNAQLVAENIANQLVRRVGFRRAMKRSMQSAMRFGVEGIRVATSGRLGGAEMARREWYLEGRVPLHTLRADIDYGFAEARTTYGVIGVKVWIYHGEVPQEQLGHAVRSEALYEAKREKRKRKRVRPSRPGEEEAGVPESPGPGTAPPRQRRRKRIEASQLQHIDSESDTEEDSGVDVALSGDEADPSTSGESSQGDSQGE
jgi:small subunit ribosomal protein S3